MPLPPSSPATPLLLPPSSPATPLLLPASSSPTPLLLPASSPNVASSGKTMREFQCLEDIHRFIDEVPFAKEDHVDEIADYFDTIVSSQSFLESGKVLHILDAYNLEGFSTTLKKNVRNLEPAQMIRAILEPEVQLDIGRKVTRQLTIRTYKFVSTAVRESFINRGQHILLR